MIKWRVLSRWLVRQRGSPITNNSKGHAPLIFSMADRPIVESWSINWHVGQVSWLTFDQHENTLPSSPLVMDFECPALQRIQMIFFVWFGSCYTQTWQSKETYFRRLVRHIALIRKSKHNWKLMAFYPGNLFNQLVSHLLTEGVNWDRQLQPLVTLQIIGCCWTSHTNGHNSDKSTWPNLFYSSIQRTDLSRKSFRCRPTCISFGLV